MDELLGRDELKVSALPPVLLRESVREELDALRDEVRGGLSALPETGILCARILARAEEKQLPTLRSVINATGVTLHTNLGRACLSERAANAAAEAARDYSTLEYDVENGCRGSRYQHVEALLCRLTGVEAAMAVNNNAAAVLLILSALAGGGEVIASRGELVEIGGSFRIPEIVTQCGCTLCEVGATNKTHRRDYEAAIGEQTRALLKVHTSNYRIVGFTESVPREELAEIAHGHGLPLILVNSIRSLLSGITKERGSLLALSFFGDCNYSISCGQKQFGLGSDVVRVQLNMKVVSAAWWSAYNRSSA